MEQRPLHSMPPGDWSPDESDSDSAEESPPEVTLHPIRGIVWAVLLGTPAAAGIVMAMNFRRLGRKTAAFAAVAISFLATAAILAVAFVTPDDNRLPNVAYALPQVFAVYFIANLSQRKQIRDHVARGGRMASAAPSVGIGLLAAFSLSAIIFAAAYWSLPSAESSYGAVVRFGADEVYYDGNATEADAERVGQALKDINYFEGNGASARIAAREGRWFVSFVLADRMWESRKMVDAFTAIGVYLAQSEVWQPLTIQLCDDEFNVKRSIPVSSVTNLQDDKDAADEMMPQE